MDTLRLFFALKDVEERILRDRFDNDTLFASFLVLLGLLGLFLGWILAVLPVDLSALDLDSLVCVSVGHSGEGDGLVSEEFVG